MLNKRENDKTVELLRQHTTFSCFLFLVHNSDFFFSCSSHFAFYSSPRSKATAWSGVQTLTWKNLALWSTMTWQKWQGVFSQRPCCSMGAGWVQTQGGTVAGWVLGRGCALRVQAWWGDTGWGGITEWMLGHEWKIQVLCISSDMYALNVFV